jgi:hypothetical protein
MKNERIFTVLANIAFGLIVVIHMGIWLAMVFA